MPYLGVLLEDRQFPPSLWKREVTNKIRIKFYSYILLLLWKFLTNFFLLKNSGQKLTAARYLTKKTRKAGSWEIKGAGKAEEGARKVGAGKLYF